ncbi:PH domain-containing protein [Flavobacterium wongokense]|uniref:PH domain-containing protein n=1 Tax=Flavobacterium wongokense TaxID=2910674 RepID=UPI001F1C3CEE|nr:PH domain-containing protein [Flavobacterium sp. WG47]MCF6133357.1 PH domain-containing protein [Flavobacterium sp. WG47]
MKIYKSKIDWWMGLPLLYPIFKSIVGIIEGEWIGYLGLTACFLFFFFISKSTRYIIEENQLTVKCLFIVNDKIDISNIRKIEKTGSILSSPALSLDRIALKFNKYDEVYISPKDKKAFVEDLLKLNSGIEVKI